jgi:hypothetical protein
MDIIVSKEKVDLQDCHVLVIGFFKDERPLKGSSGWIDWRLNGMLSRFLIEKKLTGEWKETTLIPSQGRISSTMILLLGLGELKEYSYLRVRELPPYILETLKKLGTSRVNLSLPYEGSTHVDCGKLAEVLIEGIVGCLDLRETPLDGDWIRNLKLYFAEGEEHFSEILLGVQTAQALLKERIQIRILIPSKIPSARISKIQI